ncbi:MAG: hypothetical protein ACLULM_01505 [Acutalibacter sp.]
MTGDGVSDAAKAADVAAPWAKTAPRWPNPRIWSSPTTTPPSAAVREEGIYQNIRRPSTSPATSGGRCCRLLLVPTPLLAIQLLWVTWSPFSRLAWAWTPSSGT